MLKIIIYIIHEHPKFSGIFGSVTAFLFSLIDVSATTEILNLVGVIIKDIGIIAGSSVAVVSAYVYFKKLFKKQNNDHAGNKP